MLIYGHEKQVIQLLELGTINAQIHEILKRGYQIVSSDRDFDSGYYGYESSTFTLSKKMEKCILSSMR